MQSHASSLELATLHCAATGVAYCGADRMESQPQRLLSLPTPQAATIDMRMEPCVAHRWDTWVENGWRCDAVRCGCSDTDSEGREARGHRAVPQRAGLDDGKHGSDAVPIPAQEQYNQQCLPIGAINAQTLGACARVSKYRARIRHQRAERTCAQVRVGGNARAWTRLCATRDVSKII